MIEDTSTLIAPMALRGRRCVREHVATPRSARRTSDRKVRKGTEDRGQGPAGDTPLSDECLLRVAKRERAAVGGRGGATDTYRLHIRSTNATQSCSNLSRHGPNEEVHRVNAPTKLKKYTHARATREGVHRGVRQAASSKQQ